MPASSSIPPWWIGLAGVILGFLLGEGARYARHRWEIWRNKRIVRTELQTIISQLPQKRDILQKAIAQLKQHQFLPTLSVRMVTTGYRAVVDDLYPHLSLVQRNCLHVIYERVRVTDEEMDRFQENFIEAVKDQIIDDPWGAYTGRLQELLQSFAVVEQLAQSYIAGKPIDVFRVEGP